MKTLITLFVLLAAVVLPACAQTREPPTPQNPEEWDSLRTRIKEMRGQAKEMRQAATATHAAAEKTCWDKFLVSDCLSDAKKALRETEREAKRIEVEASRSERRIQAHERAVKAQRRIDEAPQREADIAKRAGQIRRKEEAALLRMKEKQEEIGQTPGAPD